MAHVRSSLNLRHLIVRHRKTIGDSCDAPLRRFGGKCAKCEINEEHSRSVIFGSSAVAFALFLVGVFSAMLYDVMILHCSRNAGGTGLCGLLCFSSLAAAHGWTPERGRRITNKMRNIQQLADSIQLGKDMKKTSRKIINRVKILISFLQVVASMNTIYSIPWPTGFLHFLSFFSFINMNLLNVFPGVRPLITLKDLRHAAVTPSGLKTTSPHVGATPSPPQVSLDCSFEVRVHRYVAVGRSTASFQALT